MAHSVDDVFCSRSLFAVAVLSECCFVFLIGVFAAAADATDATVHFFCSVFFFYFVDAHLQFHCHRIPSVQINTFSLRPHLYLCL